MPTALRPTAADGGPPSKVGFAAATASAAAFAAAMPESSDQRLSSFGRDCVCAMSLMTPSLDEPPAREPDVSAFEGG